MPQYTQYQPKAYEPKMSAYWWLDQWHYLRYALREASSFFVGYFAIITLIQIAALDSLGVPVVPRRHVVQPCAARDGSPDRRKAPARRDIVNP
jgi:Fumarate reductase subunit C